MCVCLLEADAECHVPRKKIELIMLLAGCLLASQAPSTNNLGIPVASLFLVPVVRIGGFHPTHPVDLSQ